MPTSVPPSFTLEIQDHGSAATVRCQGRLLAESTELLYGPVSALLPTHGHIVLDLAGLTQMDSLGLGALVRLYVSARRSGCTLELRNLGKKIRDLLILTNLINSFAVAGEHYNRL